MRYNMKIQYIIGILIAFLFASCSHEEEEQKPAYGKIDVAVSVTLPQPESVNTLTRAGGPYMDTDIKNADLLIFDKDAKFMERVKVENDRLVITGTGINFTVRLDATSERRIIHLVANGRSADGTSDRLNFGDITPGMTENAAISCNAFGHVGTFCIERNQYRNESRGCETVAFHSMYTSEEG